MSERDAADLGANQPPPYEGRNLYAADTALQAAVGAHGARWTDARLHAWGAVLGRESTFALAARANRYAPELRTHDRYGARIDHVDFDPSWHALMELATREGEHSSPWRHPVVGAQVARAAAYLMHAGVENGTQCPLTMTYAAVPLLRRHGRAHAFIDTHWLPRLVATDYDARSLPITDKRAALVGMGMTERQGGSDVRSNRTEAQPAADGSYRLSGEKWFFSAPMCDAHVVLAQAAGGLSCFFMPRMLADGSRNRVLIRRLKDKLGNRSNASSEVEFAGAQAWLLGDEGRGVPVILDMVQHTRLDCAIGSAGLVRSAAAQALHHAAHRRAFGARLVEQALMRNVLADLALESEAAVWLALRLAACFEAQASESERMLARIATPALKFWLCKRAPAVVAEAMEVLGGNGYVEESPLPRLYREAPLNSIWEGAGNVMCLDVLRAARREPATVAALAEELALARGGDRGVDDYAQRLVDDLTKPAREEQARDLASRLALALAGALLVRHAPEAVAQGFCRSRLDGGYAGALGALPGGTDCATILDRMQPPT